MANKNSNSLRCRQCGMINWAADEHCRRCQQPLRKPTPPAGEGFSSKTLYIYWGVFTAAVAIPILVGTSNPEAGAGLAFFFILAAAVVGLCCNVALWVDMFRVSIVWGLSGIVLAPVSTLLFIAMYWDRARGKIVTLLASTAYIFIIFFGMSLIVKPNVARNNPAAVPSSKPVDQTPLQKTNFLPPSPSPAKNETKKKVQ